jgi:predicted DNA binding CopG/RHH family protein
MENGHGKKLTVSGTDIDEVKKRNSGSGLTYNQVKQLLDSQYPLKK